jgi:hypothetical protein
LRFGLVTVGGRPLSGEATSANIAAGQAALKTLQTRLMKPGVGLAKKKGVPLFRADPNDPSRVLREVDGRTEVGFFENGEFRTR